MRILVTGSSGYLASLVVPRLARAPEVSEIVGLDLRPPTVAPERFRHRNGSVLDPGLESLLREERIDLVLHLAWVFNPTHDPTAMREVDVGGTRHVAECAGRAGVAHLVHLSSTTAYGAHPDNPPLLAESHPVRGTRAFPYSADKADAEAELAALLPRHPGLGWTIVRPCIVLGARTDNFVRAILALPVLVRIAGHDPELQFLHEDDLADALARIVLGRPRGVFNLVPKETVRMSELARLVGRPSVTLPAPIARAAVGLLWALRLFGAPASYLDFIQWPWLADGTRLAAELGIVPGRSSREAVLAIRRR